MTRHKRATTLTHSSTDAQLESILEGLKDHAIFILNKDGLVIKWNKGAESIFGYSEEEILGKPYSILFPYEDVEAGKHKELLKKAKLYGRVEEEGWRRRRNGWFFWANPIVTALKDKSKKPQGFIIITRDMTERKRMEEILSFQKTLLEAQSEASPDGIMVVDSSGKVIYHNQRIIQLWKITPRLTAQRSSSLIFKLIKQKIVSPKNFLNYVNNLYNNPEKESKEELILKDEKTVDCYSSAIRGQDGIYYGRIWFFRDITDRKIHEKQREILVGVASHELKTPITTLKAYTQILHRRFQKIHDDESSIYISRMDEQLNKLTDLVKEMLDVVRLRAGTLIFHKELFDVNEIIKELVNDIQRTVIKYSLIIKGSAQNKVWADKHRVGQVLSNLLSNAIKYSPKNSKIIIKVSSDNKYVTVCIQDFGMGIPKDKQGLVFDQFYRISEGSRESFPGLGLGLYLSSEIIKGNDGKIWLNSQEGKGTNVYFSLPIKPKIKGKQKNG